MVKWETFEANSNILTHELKRKLTTGAEKEQFKKR